ncbi:alpha/beta fold hydrolase [Imhoffiella purpurea]|nr:alpha/beta fold hydrolase [Imhoffiella purpurea]
MNAVSPSGSSGWRGRPWLAWSVALGALIAILAALGHLIAAGEGVAIEHDRLGSVPATLYRPASGRPAPAVVLAHGFAGSQTLMRSYALTLARNGYLTVTFDFPGHGRNPEPFVSSLMDREKRLRVLESALEPAVAFALSRPQSDGRLALLGHSMAGDPLVDYVRTHPGRVGALVLLSPYVSDATPTDALPNLLLAYGALEPGMLHDQGRKILAGADGGEAREGVTYGDPASGDARRMEIAEGVEHIGILYSPAAERAALDWLDATFGWNGSGFVADRGPWIGLLYLGILVLAWPLARVLPRPAARPLGAGLGWRDLLPVAVAPAILTPLILWRLPSDFLPILIGDYLALHFALYGAISALGLWILRRRRGAGPAREPARIGRRALAIAMLAATAYAWLAFAVPTDLFVTTLLPGVERLPLVFAMLAGTLVYFVADEWVTRGPGAARGGYAATKALFLVSLLLAVALNLAELFFLIIIVPAILVFFLVYGLMSGWIYGRTRHPLVGAVANAVAFASATAVTFPVVGA